MDALFLAVHWKLQCEKWNCDLFSFCFVLLKAYSSSRRSLNSIFLPFLIHLLFFPPPTSIHLSHPQTKLSDQLIKFTNGIIYQFHPIISWSHSSSPYINKRRICTWRGSAASIAPGNVHWGIGMNTWARTSTEDLGRSHVEWSEGGVSEPSGSCLLICLSSGSP